LATEYALESRQRLAGGAARKLPQDAELLALHAKLVAEGMPSMKADAVIAKQYNVERASVTTQRYRARRRTRSQR
jgi:hypothetical protein